LDEGTAAAAQAAKETAQAEAAATGNLEDAKQTLLDKAVELAYE